MPKESLPSTTRDGAGSVPALAMMAAAISAGSPGGTAVASRLEQGHDRHPSAQVLIAIARPLRPATAGISGDGREDAAVRG